MTDPVASAAAGAGATLSNAKTKFLDKDYDVETKSASFALGNGNELSLTLDELSGAIVTQLALHGLVQKVGDSAAGAKGDYNAAKESMQGVIDNLKNGRWGAVREGEGKPKVTELAAAIAKVTGYELEQVVAKVAAATDEQRKAWRENAKVAAEIAEARAAKARERAAKAEGGQLTL